MVLGTSVSLGSQDLLCRGLNDGSTLDGWQSWGAGRKDWRLSSKGDAHIAACEVHVIGSLDLVQSLLRFGLVDRLNLWLYPLLLGSGKQVFADGTVPTALRLTYPNGTLQLVYETAGVPTYGDMAIE
jgi:RibD C-terminal domain